MSYKIKSVESNIEDLANGWLKSYGLPYKLKNESLNDDIDNALKSYSSKSGGVGGNIPDVKLLLEDKQTNRYPILIEYKGYIDKLVKLNQDKIVDNKTSKNESNFKNINDFAVNGAVHYANAVLHYTAYTDIIAIGMAGHKDNGVLKYKVEAYYVSKNNLGYGQKIGEYDDFSFLKTENFDEFIQKALGTHLSQEEKDKLKAQREKEIDIRLKSLNEHIYKNEKGLAENDRVYLVAASIIATLGIPKKLAPLDKADLKSSVESGETDGEIMIRKIQNFLNNKDLPKDKQDSIIRTLTNTLCTENINKVENGESQLKRVFTKIVDDLGYYYKIGLTTDFTGKLFNEMYNWLGFTQDKLNDVVLTPFYVAQLLVKLTKVNKDSYVWDFATGSAGLLIAAMNEMLDDAKNTINSPDEFAKKSTHIKAEQLLGLEILSDVYMLAILNMILMGDGSSNILNEDSLRSFDGNYRFVKKGEKFPATAFILNPPYSADGNGMVFAERAFSMMNSGYGAIIIQSSAGSGKAIEYNKRILKSSTLLASIKMPSDLFVGKSNVNTNIYVFEVGRAHKKDDIVKFIDFSDDGYTRTNRKKASCNLKDTNQAKERYTELVKLVHNGKGSLNIFTEKEYYEGHINVESGSDWNQNAPIDTKPTFNDFKKTVSEYLAWEVSNLLKNQSLEDSYFGSIDLKNYELSYEEKKVLGEFESITWGEYKLGDLFNGFNGDFDIQKEHINNCGEYVITSGLTDNGILGKSSIKAKIFDNNTITVDMFGNAFYRQFRYKMVTHARVFSLMPKMKMTYLQGLFISNSLFFLKFNFGYENMCSWEKIKSKHIKLPYKNGEIDFSFMESFASAIQKLMIKNVVLYMDNKINAAKTIMNQAT